MILNEQELEIFLKNLEESAKNADIDDTTIANTIQECRNFGAYKTVQEISRFLISSTLEKRIPNDVIATVMADTIVSTHEEIIQKQNEDRIEQEILDKLPPLLKEIYKTPRRNNPSTKTDAEQQEIHIPVTRVEYKKVYNQPQVLYGPPQVEKVEVREQEYVMPQVLYGPPQVEKVEVHEQEYVMPQVLYGPPQVHEVIVSEPPQVLYGPPPIDEPHSLQR